MKKLLCIAAVTIGLTSAQAVQIDLYNTVYNPLGWSAVNGQADGWTYGSYPVTYNAENPATLASGVQGTYGDYYATIYSPDINFESFWPVGQQQGDSFGAILTGCLDVETGGDLTFRLYSDDGSVLWIDGVLAVNYNGPRSAGSYRDGTVNLSAGMHAFEMHYYEDFGPPSQLKLVLPDGVDYCVPDGGSMISLLGLMLCGLEMFRRRSSN